MSQVELDTLTVLVEMREQQSAMLEMMNRMVLLQVMIASATFDAVESVNNKDRDEMVEGMELIIEKQNDLMKRLNL